MKLLAVDASGQVASTALITEEGIRAVYTVDYRKTHSQTLLPMIDEILRMTETDKHSLDVIAVSEGPGSFTGLRIGAATVKGLAAALNKPVAAVPTLEMLAYNFCGTEELVCPMMDARRNQVYTGLYAFEEEKLCIRISQRACALEEIIRLLNEQERQVVLLGDAIDAYRDELEQKLTCPHRFAAAHMYKQNAASLAVLALWRAQRGEVMDGAMLVPEYLRMSQAERERNEKQKTENAGKSENNEMGTTSHGGMQVC